MSDENLTDLNDSTIPKIRPENIRILCIDSDESCLKNYQQIFQFRAYNITLLKTGKEAIQLWESKEFDIVLCDSKLSDMSGIDVLENFKNTNPDAIRILISADSDSIDISKAINQGGIYRLISKPWNEDDLMYFVISAVELTISRKEEVLILEEAKRNNKKLSDLVDSLESKVQESSVLLTAANRKIQSS